MTKIICAEYQVWNKPIKNWQFDDSVLDFIFNIALEKKTSQILPVAFLISRAWQTSLKLIYKCGRRVCRGGGGFSLITLMNDID